MWGRKIRDIYFFHQTKIKDSRYFWCPNENILEKKDKSDVAMSWSHDTCKSEYNCILFLFQQTTPSQFSLSFSFYISFIRHFVFIILHLQTKKEKKKKKERTQFPTRTSSQRVNPSLYQSWRNIWRYFFFLTLSFLDIFTTNYSFVFDLIWNEFFCWIFLLQ